ncbi:sensor histidine kinase [Aquimarina litoralis]|uniref:sensor histidine kinase n=1 Tax=Aquimarina litoralis TaxID=584605 RepID=UPI001C567493|nr:sensor histidine kinase [Aquimarina litoralis]MBW1296891.1 histidine kinase [Aquimarina litoralis]
MDTRKEFLYNGIIITIIFLVDLLGDYIISNRDIFSTNPPFFLFKTAFIIALLSVYAVNYLYNVPRFLFKKKYLLYSLSFIGMILLFGGLRFLLEEVVLYHITGIHNYHFDVPVSQLITTYSLDSFYYTLRACLVSTAICLFFRYSENKEQIHHLNIAHERAKLSALKSQISPHFLFNTLNNFYEELYDDKPETANDILKLSELLRYVTYETNEDVTFLSKEITFIEDYLYFFKRRYEDNFHVSLHIDGMVHLQKIPSLMLIHFVENVCKHGIINDVKRPASIRLNIQEGSLILRTENYINTSEQHTETGIGTENIKQRLEVLYQDNFILEHTNRDNQFEAFLELRF